MRIALKIFLRNRQCSIRNTKKGFTLIELLVSITIFALAGVAVHTVLATGITAWRRGNKDRTCLRKIRLATESMARDLRNTFEFSGIAFEGKKDSISFPALILTFREYAEPDLSDSEESSESDSNLDENETGYEVGRAAYFYDKKRKAMRKEEKSFSEAYQQEGKIGKGKILFEHLRKLEFSYCYLDNVTGDYKWKNDWKEEEQDSIPQAVKIKMIFEKKIGLEDFERTIFIPIGTGEQKITFE